MENIDNVLEFYENGAENGRLERGLGKIELHRTKEILNKYIKNKNNTIYDIGGGIGVYSSWLAEKGNKVHLLELAPSAVKTAIENQSKTTFIAEVCDARNLDREDESADIVLLIGPLYHLQNKGDRKRTTIWSSHKTKRISIFPNTSLFPYSNRTSKGN